MVGEFNTNEEAAATIEKVWSAANGTVHHVCNSLGFGAVGKPYSETTFDDLSAGLSTHSGARLRAHPLCVAKLLNVEGSSLTTLSGAFAYGTHTFDGGSGLWGAGIGGAATGLVIFGDVAPDTCGTRLLRFGSSATGLGCKCNTSDARCLQDPLHPSTRCLGYVGSGAIVVDINTELGVSYQLGVYSVATDPGSQLPPAHSAQYAMRVMDLTPGAHHLDPVARTINVHSFAEGVWWVLNSDRPLRIRVQPTPYGRCARPIRLALEHGGVGPGPHRPRTNALGNSASTGV